MTARKGRARLKATVNERDLYPELEHVLASLVPLLDDLADEKDEDGLLRASLDHLVAELELAGGALFVLDDTGRLQTAAEHSVVVAEMPELEELGRSALQQLSVTYQPAPQGGAFVAGALTVKEQALGSMVLLDPRPDGSSVDPGLMTVAGKIIGTGVDRNRAIADLRGTSQRAEFLNRMIATLTSGDGLETAILRFAREFSTVQGFDQLACGFLNESADYIEVCAYPAGSHWGLGSVIPVVGSGPGSVVLGNAAIVETNLLRRRRFIEDLRLLEEGIRSYILLPLTWDARTIGVLGLASKEVGAYDDDTVGRLQPVADSVALALENIRLFEKTRELAITDEVTPLYSVRYFHQFLDRELELVDRYDSVLSLAFFDLDRFKPINDRWGHLRGSRVLREIGFLLHTAVREQDLPARYGGDEFVVVMPQTDREEALAVAEVIRQVIEENVFLQEEGIDATLGVSLGVATYPREASSKEDLIRLADRRMYENKGSRDAVRIVQPGSVTQSE